MQLKFGSFPVVVASSSESAKLFLKTHDQIFASRPATAAGKYNGYNFTDMLWSPYGPYWRQARRLYTTELFSPKQLDACHYIRAEEMRGFTTHLRKEALLGKPVQMRKHLTRFTLTNIIRMVYGYKYFSSGENEDPKAVLKLEEVEEMVEEWFFLGGVFNIGDWIPWLEFLDLQGYVKRMKALQKKLARFHSHVISDHEAKRRAMGEDFVPKDMVDVVLQLAQNPKLEVKLTSESIKGLLLDPITGGTDTSSHAVEWALSELLKHPQILRKASEELDKVVGRERWVEEGDIPQLPFLNAVVKETLRLHPVATLLPPHYSIEDCTVGDFDIPKGTTLLVNVWSIGRDRRYWDEPKEFRPERFLEGSKKKINLKGQDFELLPFGSGRRRCPAYSLGLKLVQSTLANLIQGFELKLPDPMKPEDVSMEEEYGLTTHRAIPLAVVLEPRLPSHFY
ncbi:Flavonoid 3'-monooxygenase [Bertholletia excelsa]